MEDAPSKCRWWWQETGWGGGGKAPSSHLEAVGVVLQGAPPFPQRPQTLDFEVFQKSHNHFHQKNQKCAKEPVLTELMAMYYE